MQIYCITRSVGILEHVYPPGIEIQWKLENPQVANQVDQELQEDIDLEEQNCEQQSTSGYRTMNKQASPWANIRRT